MRAARDGQLKKPDVLAAQTRRMLADARSSAFVANFAGQWLHLRNLKGKVPNSELFPDFDDNLRQAFQREAELFFESIIRDDRSVLDLMTADYTFVNERLARHYGIPNVFGSDFRRVPLPDETRRGILGQGRRAARDVARHDDLAGAARQVGAREPRRRAAAGAARRSRYRAQDRSSGLGAEDDARADGAASDEPGLRELSPGHGSDRLRPRELRRRRRVADEGRRRPAAQHRRRADRRDEGRRRGRAAAGARAGGRTCSCRR